MLKNLYESGARFFMWGYETESERVMALINKGIDLKFRKRILQDAKDAGLWNLCTFLLGFPTETQEELQSTIDVIYNHDLINTCTPSNFALKKNAILKDNISSVGITDFTQNGELHISYKYNSDSHTMDEVKKNRNTFEKKFLEEVNFTGNIYPEMVSEDETMQINIRNHPMLAWKCLNVKNYRSKQK